MQRPAAASPALLITGCSSGIGKATALRLQRSGAWTVFATARRQETLADLAAAGCRTLALDVTDEASMQAAVAAVEASHGVVSVLVNNAGYQQTGAIETVAMEDMRRQFETNVFGLMRLVQLVAPGMRRQGWGRIVNVSSMGGKLTIPGGGAYHASKHAVEALSDALRFELAPFGVDVVVIEPGLIRTEFAAAAINSIEAHQETGPYADFNASIRPAYASMERSPTALIVSPADDVAKAIARAIGAARPRTRYRVGISAHIFMGLRGLVSDRLWDRIVARLIPPPRPA